MHRLVLDEAFRLSKAYAEAERLCRQKPQPGQPEPDWHDLFEKARMAQSTLVAFHLRVERGDRACLRCSDREGRCVLKESSEFYESQPWWCRRCVLDYQKSRPKNTMRVE